ncbi:MAG: DUF2834 domain-containing protein [Arcobacteraceae bacterium]
MVFEFVKMKYLYLLLCILGVFIPYWQFILWLSANGINMTLFFNQILQSRLSLFAWTDVVLSAIVLIVFIVNESKRLKMKQPWVPIIGTLFVGVSFGLPLFLYLREIYMCKKSC